MPINMMIKLEGIRLTAYDCTAGRRTVGIGFNMESYGSRKLWSKLNIKEDFDDVFNRESDISVESSKILFNHTWNWCENRARNRCEFLGLEYDQMEKYKKFILADIAYNTGSVKKWSKVFYYVEPKSVLFEARRNPKEILDSRISKIGYYFGIIKTIEEAKEIGIEFAVYLK